MKILARLLLASALAAATPAWPQAPAALPAHHAAPAETPASRQARAFLAAATSGDEASFLKFIADNVRPPTLPVEAWRDQRPNLAKLQFHALVSATPTSADLLV